MPALIDTPSNTKIIYLFVKNFKWTHNVDKETSVGHPKTNRLYRAVKNTDTKSYRVMYPIEKSFQGFLLDKLQSDDENNGYTADIREIALENILDFEIKEDDLNELNHWLETDNKDLQDWMNKFFGKSKNKSEKITDVLRSNDPELAAVVSMISDLRNIDPLMYVGLGFFVTYLLKKNPEPESAINDDWIKLDKNLGAGANLSAAIKKLSAYGSTDRRTNLMSDDLMEAIRHLLTEQYRREANHLK